MLSTIFVCHERPNLTELCLRRVIEVAGDRIDEFIMCYDGDNEDYIQRMDSIAQFGKIVNEATGGKYERFKVVNRAYEECEGDLFFHLMSDYWLEHEKTITDALYAINNYDVDLVRFEQLPHRKHKFREIKKLLHGKLGIYKSRQNGGPRYQFATNPHIRKEKFPCGKFSVGSTDGGTPESEYNDRWCEADKVSSCLIGNNCRHLGVYDHTGWYYKHYTPRFKLERGYKPEKEVFEPIKDFKEFCDNDKYIELFTKYINNYKNKSD